jgi:deazaflavin-dependent oxidoreductase (nitroreductase family)
MTGNNFMAWVLRSPFHGILSNGMMLITVIGRKTGKPYTLPISYYREDDCLWVITSRDRTWWRNIKGGRNVSLLLKHESVCAFAEAELDAKCVEARLYDYAKRMPMAAKQLVIRMENGVANVEDISRIAKDRLFVRIQLKPA